jgi:phenylacetate-CoA ligase
MNVAAEPERLDRAGLLHRQTQRLRALVAEIVPANRFWANRFAAAGLAAGDIRQPADLQKLPFVTKAELVADQQAFPPYGSNLTYPVGRYIRLHQTSGTTGAPLRWLDTPQSWAAMMESWSQIFRMVGLRPEDRLCFPFSFGPFLGFWAAFEGANRLGNLCLAAGGMSSQARLRLIADNQATFVCCTPTYAVRLVEEAAAAGLDLGQSSVRGLIVAGEPGGNLPTLRARMEAGWGARVFDHWGMTELGPLATECLADPGNLAVLETECIAEIIDPQTGRPVSPGDPGELVITNLGRAGSPLLRYRTGDIVQADLSPSPGGYELLRLKGGILSRSDDMLTIRGNNIYPSALEELLRQFPAVAEYRIQVRSVKAMQHIHIEVEPTSATDTAGETPALLEKIAHTVKDRLNFQVDVTAAACGSLPRFEMKGKRLVRIVED